MKGVDLSREKEIEEYQKNLNEIKDNYAKEAFVERMIIFVDLASSTSFKYEYEESYWVKRQVDFLSLVSKVFLEKFNEDKMFYKHLGDAVFISIQGGFENVIPAIDECIKEIKKHNDQNLYEPFRFHMAIDFGFVKLLIDDPIGQCVDRCSRILSITNDEHVLISEDAFIRLSKDCANFECRRLDNILLKGIKNAINLFEYKYDGKKRKLKIHKEVPGVFKRKTEIHRNDNNVPGENKYSLEYQNEYEYKHKPLKIAAFGPHVDDIELGCGATLAKLIDNFDVELYYYILSFGRLEWDGENNKSGISRLTDAKKSFKYLLTGSEELNSSEKDIDNIEFKLYDDENSDKIIGKFKAFTKFHDAKLDEDINVIRQEIRKLQTKELNDVDLIFMPSLKDVHQDHKVLATISIQIFRKHETVLFYRTPDSGKHPADRFNPNLYLDVSESIRSDSIYETCDQIATKAARPTYADVKLHLLKLFSSETEKHWYDELSFLSTMREYAVDAYLPTATDKNKFAEGFEGILRY